MTEKDYEQVKTAFDSYYQSYQDISDDIRHKYDHSYRVAHFCLLYTSPSPRD